MGKERRVEYLGPKINYEDWFPPIEDQPTYITLNQVVDNFLKSLPPPKKSFMKHLQALLYNVVQFRMAEYSTVAGILSLFFCLIFYSFWPLTVTIILPLVGFMIAEQKKYKSTGKY